MHRQLGRALATASILALSLAAGAAHAQQGVAVEELVVTAQKQRQQAIDVPIALTAYSGAQLEKLGIRDFADLSLFTPGLEVQEQSPNNAGFVVRGITSDSTSSFDEARVSVFQDGVSISKAQASYVELFDLERVEVAKGPQSTLFGRGALIGGVNLIQKKASTGAVDGYLHLEGGDYSMFTAEGAVNLPVSDSVALRISGRSRTRDGYVDNALGGDAFQSVDSKAARVALKFAPNARFDGDLIFNYQEDHPTGTSFKSMGYSPTNPLTAQVLASRKPQDPATLAAAADFRDGGLGIDRNLGGVTGLFAYKVSDALTLNSISAFRRYSSKEVFDPDGLSLPILTAFNDASGKQWSQEFRLNFDDGGRVRGFVGVDGFLAKDSQRVPLEFDERMSLAVLTGQLNAGAAGSGLPATTPAPAAVFGNTAFTGALLQGLVAQLSGGRVLLPAAQARAIAANLRSNHVEEARTTSDLATVDLFADLTAKLTDKLEVSAGLRYTRDDKTTGFASRVIGGRSVLGGAIGAAQLAGTGAPGAVTQANAILAALASPAVQQIPSTLLPLFGLTDQPTPHNGDLSQQDLTDDGLTWRLVGRYAVSDDANVYASYARGRRPEVLAATNADLPEQPPRFDPVAAETVDSYEVGSKLALLQHRVRLDGAVYYYDYKNFQTQEQRGTQFIITNAGKAKAYGFEGQVEWAAAPGLQLYATYAYNHARFDGGAFDGNHFRLSPDHSLSLAADWQFDGLGGTFNIRPSYTWQSKIFFDDNNDLPQFQQPPNVFVADNVQDEFQKSYGLLNLRIDWKPAGLNATFEVFATNLLDEEYVIDAGNTGDSFGLPTFIAGPPRMVGASVTWRYR